LIHDTANEKITAMNEKAAAAPFEPVGDLMAFPSKCLAPVPAATHQTMKGGIHRKASRRCIQVMPKAHMIQTVVQIKMTPAHCGNLPSESAYRTEAPEILLTAFHPVVETILNTTTSKLPQYPKEYLEKLVILSPVRPKVAVHAGKRQLARFTTTMIAKQSQNERPILPPIVPTLRVATAMFALNLLLVKFL
jgi:hypothetical protein